MRADAGLGGGVGDGRPNFRRNRSVRDEGVRAAGYKRRGYRYSPILHADTKYVLAGGRELIWWTIGKRSLSTHRLHRTVWPKED
ncbi:MAG: hypothetical protein ACLTMP_05295 [Eggerthella lenta]